LARDRVPGFSAAYPLVAKQAKSKTTKITRILSIKISLAGRKACHGQPASKPAPARHEQKENHFLSQSPQGPQS
jgi:hypothetical protein